MATVYGESKCRSGRLPVETAQAKKKPRIESAVALGEAVSVKTASSGKKKVCVHSQTRASSTQEMMDTTKLIQIRSVVGMSELLNDIVKKNDSLDEPIYVGQLEHLNIWDEYSLLDGVPLLPKYLFLDDDHLDLFIIELPTDKHEYMAQNIFARLRDQCQYVDSLGSGRTNHKEAEESIRPDPDTPNVQLPQGVSMADLSTLVIEVGLSQKWTGIGGLDDKAKKWFQDRNSLGLQYILCVKIDLVRQTQKINDVSYKLYDLQLMAGNFRTFAPTHLGLQQNVPAIAQIQFDAHRLLSIPVNQPLPPGFIRNTFVINLETIRDKIIRTGI